MKRKILFRGKRVDNGEWVYGDLVQFGGNKIYHTESAFSSKIICSDVIPDSVGQYTGITDKDSINIFEGDILTGGIFLEYEVEWDFEDGGWNIGESAYNFKVIGSIHDKK